MQNLTASARPKRSLRQRDRAAGHSKICCKLKRFPQCRHNARGLDRQEFAMNFVSKSEEILQKLVPVVFLLAGSIVGVAAAQQKPKTPPPSPKPSAPHVSTPARSSTSRPSTATHSSTTGARPGTARPGTTNGRTATGTAAKNGTVVRGKTGTGPVGRNGAASGMNNRGGANMGGGGHGAMAKSVNRPAPGRQVSLRGGGTANIRPNGQIRSINRNGMHIEHGLNGSRRIESTHNGAHIVTTGRNSGYVQRAYVTRGVAD